MHWTLQQWRDSSSPGHCSQLQWPETDRMTCWSPRHRRSHRWDRNSSILEFFCFLCFISTNFYFFLFTLFTVTEISDGSWPSGRQCLSGAATGANSRGQQWRCRLKDHSHSVDQLQAVKGTVFLIHGLIHVSLDLYFYFLSSFLWLIEWNFSRNEKKNSTSASDCCCTTFNPRQLPPPPSFYFISSANDISNA